MFFRSETGATGHTNNGLFCNIVKEPTGLISRLHKMELKVQVYTFRNDDDLPFTFLQVT